MENYNNQEMKSKNEVSVHQYISTINQSINIPDVLKKRTRYGGYVCWPKDKKTFSKNDQSKN